MNDVYGKYKSADGLEELELKALLNSDREYSTFLVEGDNKYELLDSGKNWLLFEEYHNVKISSDSKSLLYSKGTNNVTMNTKKYLKY